MAGFEDKVKKAKQQIDAAKASASASAKAKVLTDITDQAKAQAKVKRDYANTLKGTLDSINAQLDAYVTKVARGDKLDTTQQKELDRLIKQAQSVSSTIDKALKDAVNIEAQGLRDYASTAARQRGAAPAATPSTYNAPTGTPTAAAASTAMPQGQQTPAKPTPRTPARQTPTPTPTPTAGESMAGAVTQFNQGRPTAAAGQGPSGPSGPTKVPTPLETLLKKTEFWYDLPDYIFTAIPKLGEILVQAVNEGWDKNKFLAAAQLTPWWQSNSEKFRQKIIDKAKYDELKTQGVDVSKTDYGQAITKIIRSVKSDAKTIGGITLDDAQAQQIAEKIYNGNLEDDPLAIRQLIIPFIGKFTDKYAGSTVTTYGGEALRNYQMLQAIAKANGLQLKDILPQISAITAGGDLEKAVLQGIASGDIDIARVAQNARMVAAQGQPEYVRNLLNQGYDLEQIYSPYKTTMASVLELNPDQIDLNDPTLRSAINNNGDMNIYDFKKTLRKDSRWQYTEGARQEVASSVLGVLRDFGFQG